MSRKRTLATLFVVSLIATMALVYVTGAPSGPDSVSSGDTIAATEGAGDESGRAAGRRDPRGATPRSSEEQDELEDRLILMLRQLYGDRISSTAVQILMAQIRTQVQTLFPEDWASRFPQILEAAFPGHSAKI